MGGVTYSDLYFDKIALAVEWRTDWVKNGPKGTILG